MRRPPTVPVPAPDATPFARAPIAAVVALAAAALAAGSAGAQSTDGAVPDTAAAAEASRSAAAALRAGTEDAAWARWAERAAGLATLLAADRGVRRTASDLRRRSTDASVSDELAEIGNDLGTWKKTAPFLAAGALGGGALLDGLSGAGRGASVLAGVVAGSMASEALNRAVGRGRPAWGRGAYSFRPFTGHASFPSGHAAYLFSVAGAVDAATDGWLPAAAAYGAAGLSAYGRVYEDRHWLSDVVVGAVLGSTVSRLATERAMRMLGVAGDGAGNDGDAGDARPGRGGAEVSLLATPSRLGVTIRF